MVLGPAAEFAVETPAEAGIDVPAGWQRSRVTGMRLPHPLAWDLALLGTPRSRGAVDELHSAQDQAGT